MDSQHVYGGIEAGGTKFVCAIGTDPDNIFATTRFPTTTPEETIGKTVAFFRDHLESLHLSAIGISSFGPVDPRPTSPTYGFITTTPKQVWRNTDFAGSLSRALGVPVAFDTDVNGAAFGEYRWGAAQGLDTFLYLTVGTGIGGGGMVGGERMHGLIHPEMGHIFLPRSDGDTFEGVCPSHGSCLEGLACGPAIESRWNVSSARSLPPDHEAWNMEAHYLSLALVNFICTFSPQRIIMGGGVMEQLHLFPIIRNNVQRRLNGYIHSDQILHHIDEYIVPPALGNQAGVLGALALAAELGDS